MRTLTFIVVGTILVLGAPEAAAQQPLPGSWELGGAGQYTSFRQNAGCACFWPDDAIGVAGRVGVFYDRRFSFEVDGSTTNADRLVTTGTTRHSTVALRANLNHFFGDGFVGPSLLAGAGPVLTRLGSSNEVGVSGLAGVRYGFSERFGLRLDGTVDYMPGDENLNLAGRLGASILLGRSPAPRAPRPLAQERTPEPAPTPPAAVVEPEPDPPPAVPEPATTDDTSVLTAPVFFDYDRAEIRPDARAVLDLKLRWLQANPDLRLRLEGNADERGTTAYNYPLGTERALAVHDYLVARGIAANRIEVVSHGDLRPACTNSPASDECHQINRRVEFTIVSGGERLRVPEG